MPFLLRTHCLLALFLLGTTPVPCIGAVIEGIVFSDQGPVSGAQVQAHESFQYYADKKEGILSTVGEKPGQFRIEVPPGKYYFSAHGNSVSPQQFSYHGGNPITISEKYYWMPFFTVESNSYTCKEGPTGICGQAFFHQAPITQGSVSLYTPADDIFRGMGILTNSLDHEGKFRFDLDPGEYVIIARQRKTASGMGPLQKGDLFCFSDKNPITITPGMSCQLDINCYPRDDLLTFLQKTEHDPRGRKEQKRRNLSLWDTIKYDAAGFQPKSKVGQSLLTGTVTDPSGQGLSGLFVQAYPANYNTLFQMYMIRLITDHIVMTDANGAFQMQLEAGHYFLVAREKMGEAPDRYEYYGLYEGNSNHSVSIKSGDTVEIQIVAEQIMPKD